jgi:membrane protease subunit HflC
MKRNLTFVVGAILIAIFIMLLFVFQVRTTEVAVVTTFGKATRPLTEPGPYLKWPWPIQRVHKFDKRVHNFETKLEQVFTSDRYSLLVMVYTGWQISKPEVFFPKFNGSIKQAEESLEGLIRNASSGVAGQHAFSHFISTEEKELKFAQIEQEILERIQADAGGYGITNRFIGIKKLELPESVTESVFERMKSARQVQENEIKFEGQRLADNIRSQANLESAKVLAEADATSTTLRGLGERKAAESFEVYKQEPDLANFLLNLNGIEQLLKEKTTLILDEGTPPLDLLRKVPATPH